MMMTARPARHKKVTIFMVAVTLCKQVKLLIINVPCFLALVNQKQNAILPQVAGIAIDIAAIV